MTTITNSSLVLISCKSVVPSNTTIGFHAESTCGRGTASIIWNCLTVMIFAVWSTIHLSTRTLHSPLWYKSLLQTGTYYFWSPWRRLLRKEADDYMSDVEFPNFTSRKILEAVITVLFPETGVVVAVEEVIVAWYIRRATSKVEGWESFSLKQAHLIAMGGILVPGLEATQDFDQLVLRRKMSFAIFPTHAQISRRAKKDYTDKAIALFQGVYFIGNCWMRYRHKYRLARLEFIALNYLIYAVLVSALRYSKPQELQDPFQSKWSHEGTDIDYLGGSGEGRGGVADLNSPFYIWYTRKRWHIFALILLALGTAGVLNFCYRIGPTHETQSLLWRITFLGIVCISCLPLRQIAHERNALRAEKPGLLDRVADVYVGMCCLGYVALRLYLLVGAFLRFRVATADVYVTAPSWTQYLGHVGG
ncbi:uncharacterized protein K460DRAFT_364950 [Cucurbitaria berberidis CBS 394.84]|uniref:Uncharacterized protein n=1 Tax=Cucurbitaria berberidis CBS 394.84 TaxID=1168544 RepID=A0A9P4GPW1_9PLEO|nr:uncharacterized protein K460DRAFT_364950 [Cucurbitaria berberidis CBS 394.84]KAF1849040.1 hypothetical protein K460DRAFT_364950 [Cucurbitaria berberidis CBS 394.84]